MSCVALIYCIHVYGLIAIKQQEHTHKYEQFYSTTANDEKKSCLKNVTTVNKSNNIQNKASPQPLWISHLKQMLTKDRHTVAIGAVEMKCTVLISAHSNV